MMVVLVVRRYYSLSIFFKSAYIIYIYIYLYKYGNVVYDRRRRLSNHTIVILLSYHVNGPYTIYMIFDSITYYYYLDMIYTNAFPKKNI